MVWAVTKWFKSYRNESNRADDDFAFYLRTTFISYFIFSIS